MNGFGLTPATPATLACLGGRVATARSNRRAFTLVELLVVIVIIGILIALLVPTIGSALSGAKVARMGLEVSNLAKAVEAYRMEMGAYPPDFANPTPELDAQQISTHMARKFRYRSPMDQSQLPMNGLDPAEALVFWLNGFSKDQKLPLVRRESLDPAAAIQVPLKGDKPFFEFEQSRLKDLDGDGYPEYYPTDSELPYVYIRNDSYGTQNSNGVFIPNEIPILNGNTASVRAYAAELLGTAVKRFADAEKYQIICAGVDGEFGAGSVSGVAAFPDGVGYAEADEDNLTSFSEGKTLQDSIP